MLIFKNKKTEISDLLLQLKKEVQTKPKASRRKEIIMIRVEINEIENRKIEKIR